MDADVTVRVEALLRGRKVTTLGAPFYAGWGLTKDVGMVPERRIARPNLAQLAHATLIAYPRYFDPITRSPCPVEVVVERAGVRHAATSGSYEPEPVKATGCFCQLCAFMAKMKKYFIFQKLAKMAPKHALRRHQSGGFQHM